ncbi:MAG TPA: aldehyde dehydrogenase family protein [Polyangia bacterium]|jgi:succinate-semialdehyde dehydrogenase/glutarate-semialdehyde dehydrogenase
MGALASVDRASSDTKRDVIVSSNPATGEVLGEVRESSAAEIRDAVSRARGAQAAWGALSVKERCERVGRFRDLVVARAEELCALISAETGKTRAEALSMEVMIIADLITYFAKRAPRILAPEPISLHLLKNRASYLHYQPRGVVGIIAPWNFPFGIATGEMAMALIAGNAVVLKPSEVTPLIALKTKELYDASGMPTELFQVVPGRGAAGAALIDSGIDYCIFTGSTATGKKVGAACGERLIPCTLELGGKAPAIVCADADIDRTARALVWGAFANQGQVCVSVERVYAHQSVHDELVAKIIANVDKLRPGQDTGSMTWERQTEIVEERIASAVKEGAKVRTGGKRQGDKGLAFAPTVLTDCRQDMEVMKKEIFGPVMPIMKVRDEEEAVALANDSSLGLMAYVFTADKKKGQRLAEKIESGTTMVNDVLITFGAPETPWAGVKQSGVGLTHSDRGLQDLCQTRHVNYDRIALKKELWWYPYSDKVYKQTLKMMRWIFR